MTKELEAAIQWL